MECDGTTVLVVEDGSVCILPEHCHCDNKLLKTIVLRFLCVYSPLMCCIIYKCGMEEQYMWS